MFSVLVVFFSISSIRHLRKYFTFCKECYLKFPVCYICAMLSYCGEDT